MLMLRECYASPTGNSPPTSGRLAMSTRRSMPGPRGAFKIEKKRSGRGDRVFLERVFQKLLLNFTWWVNRKDTEGRNVFQGGFLGLDNIGVFDRSRPLPTGGNLEQSTARVGWRCTTSTCLRLRWNSPK